MAKGFKVITKKETFEKRGLIWSAQIAEGAIFKFAFLHNYVTFWISKVDRQLRAEKLVWKNGWNNPGSLGRAELCYFPFPNLV